MPQTEQKFISESITPVLADTGTDFMVSGGPAFPREFVWRGKPLTITSLIRTWDETGPCTHGSGERYVRKHWFEVETGSH